MAAPANFLRDDSVILALCDELEATGAFARVCPFSTPETRDVPAEDVGIGPVIWVYRRGWQEEVWGRGNAKDPGHPDRSGVIHRRTVQVRVWIEGRAHTDRDGDEEAEAALANGEAALQATLESWGNDGTPSAVTAAFQSGEEDPACLPPARRMQYDGTLTYGIRVGSRVVTS